MVKNFALVFLITIFLFLRIFNLEKGVNFSAEQGLTLEKVHQIIKTGKHTLIGPETSFKTKNGRAFYTGPATYYLLIPPMVIFNGDPIAISYYLIFLNLIALLILYFAIEKKAGRQRAFWSALFFTTFPQLITYSRFVWNPNFLPLFSAILLFLLQRLQAESPELPEMKKNRRGGYFILLGLNLGFCLQFHYQAILLIILTFSWLIIKKIPIKNFFSLIIGFIIGFSPLIIFELRHQFYNLNTLLLILREGTSKNLTFLPFYYLLSLVPFMAYLTGFFIQKIINFNRIFALLLVLLYLVWVTGEVYSFGQQAPGMPKGWNYPGQKKVTQIILEENKKNYNIANLLTGDTRERAIRYLLTIRDKPPVDVESYPQADWLFVISRYDEERTKKDPVWEISSFVPSNIVKQWPIQNGINLYLFEKIKVDSSTSDVDVI